MSDTSSPTQDTQPPADTFDEPGDVTPPETAGVGAVPSDDAVPPPVNPEEPAPHSEFKGKEVDTRSPLDDVLQVSPHEVLMWSNPQQTGIALGVLLTFCMLPQVRSVELWLALSLAAGGSVRAYNKFMASGEKDQLPVLSVPVSRTNVNDLAEKLKKHLSDLLIKLNGALSWENPTSSGLALAYGFALYRIGGVGTLLGSTFLRVLAVAALFSVPKAMSIYGGEVRRNYKAQVSSKVYIVWSNIRNKHTAFRGFVAEKASFLNSKVNHSDEIAVVTLVALLWVYLCGVWCLLCSASTVGVVLHLALLAHCYFDPEGWELFTAPTASATDGVSTSGRGKSKDD